MLNFRQEMFLQMLGKAFAKLFSLQGVKTLSATLLSVVQLIGAVIFDTPVTPCGDKINLQDWSLVWSDEFDGDSLDMTKWSVNSQGVRRGGYWCDSQVSVKDGNLVIRTEHLDEGRFGEGWYSAEVETLDKADFLYGYMECRCICAPGEGLWSAFWTFSHGVGKIDGSGKDGAEIDIFESPCYARSKWRRNSVTHAVHFDGYGEDHQWRFLGNFYADEPYTKYNTYGLEWNENEMIYYINGVETARIADESVPNVREWLKLSVEVNGTDAVPGLTNDGTIDGGANGIITNNGGNDFSSDFIVDYVRVYEKK